MKSNAFRRYYIGLLASLLLVSAYPIYMGISVVVDMIQNGTVYAEDYPKYIIPYTPIALALLLGVALLPVLMKRGKRLGLMIATAISTVVFFLSEFLLESLVTVTRTVTELVPTYDSSKLEDWQMYMCYIPPTGYEERTWTEVDVLLGEYSPWFKLHFYMISLVLIFALLNCFYGFARMILTKDYSRTRALTMQSVAGGLFLGMCILACFTAFFRDGSLTVSAVSALLMAVFFILLGVTVGLYTASFTLKRRRLFSVILPSVSASLVTLLMYIGEMILLSGHLYRFGNGFFFMGLGAILLAPVDLLIILLSGVLTATLALLLTKPKNARSA